MRATNPSTNNPQLLESRLNQMNEGRVRVLDLDFAVSNATTVRILPGKDKLDRFKIRAWMKNRVWVIDDDGHTIDMTAAGIGGRLDGLALAANEQYLFWLIGQRGGVGIDGFGVTRKPRAIFTGSGLGLPGTTSVYTMSGTGTNNAYQFGPVGSRVIVRSQNFGPPNYAWNHGTITGITSPSEIQIQLDSGLLGSTTVTASGGLNEIIQTSGFRPWNGTSPGAGQTYDDTYYSDTYRLIGEGLTNASNQLTWHRRTQDEWAHFNQSYPPSSFPDPGGATVYDFYRYCPTWVNRIALHVAFEHELTEARIAWNPNESTALSYLVFDQVLYNANAPIPLYANYFGEALLMNNRHTVTVTAITGAGLMNFYPTIISVQDGGLRE